MKGYSYRHVEEEYDRNKRNQDRIKKLGDEIDELKTTIIGLTKEKNQTGFTDEQCFFISYYDLDKEKCKNTKFNMNNIRDYVDKIKNIPGVSSEKLEENRHEALLDVFFATEDFSKDKANRNKDNFHGIINDWNQYSEDFEKNPLIVKQMINLQALNRMAHQYRDLFEQLLENRDLINQLSGKNQPSYKLSRTDIEDMLSSRIDKIREDAKSKLVKKFGEKQVEELENEEYLKYYANASRWMFKEKDLYVEKILEKLQNSNGEYNYGILDDGFIFEVPGYGQFGVHMGWKEYFIEVKEKYDVKDYDGVRLDDVYLLSKASPELLKNVNVDELSEEDKQRYRIANAGIIKEENEIKKKSVEELIEESPNKEEAQKIIEVLRKEGLKPEEFKLDTILKKGKSEAIKKIIDTIKTNQYGIGVDIFYRCNTLLSCNTEKASDIMLMFDEINKLGIDVKDLVSEYPNFLTVSKSDKMEDIYNVLKKYKIDLTNHNIGVAFEGNAQNIKKNIDLLIENGMYDLVKVGNNKFFTSNNKNLNMRINLHKQQNEALTTENGSERRLNSKIFLTESSLMTKYGITKKEILEEFGKIKGQELIKDSQYYIEQDNKEIKLSDEQQKISSDIFEKLEGNITEDGIVIKIGDYFYSAIKVKEQIDEIIANTDIQDLEREDSNEILKIALLKNKNIDQKEIDEISTQIENSTKNENITEYNEIQNITNDIIETQQNIEDVEQIISKLKEVRGTLKNQIKEMEERLNNTILENDEPSSEIIQDIKELKKIISEQKEKRKETKQMIKKYKETKKTMKYTLKQQKEERNSSIDELEI